MSTADKGHTHTVVEGETLDRIAHAHGVPHGHGLYHHPANAALREKRPDPRFIAPGDEVFVPQVVPATVCKTNRRYVFQRIPKPEVCLRVADPQGHVLEGLPYALDVDGDVHHGEIPAGGVIRHVVPLRATAGELRVTMPDGRTHRWPLAIGFLEPAETNLGLQARLANLGHYHGPLDGALRSAAVHAALDEFRTEKPPDGLGAPVTEAERARVAHEHGS